MIFLMTCKANGFLDRFSCSMQPRYVTVVLFNMYSTISNIKIAIFLSLFFFAKIYAFGFFLPKMNAKFGINKPIANRKNFVYFSVNYLDTKLESSAEKGNSQSYAISCHLYIVEIKAPRLNLVALRN